MLEIRQTKKPVADNHDTLWTTATHVHRTSRRGLEITLPAAPPAETPVEKTPASEEVTEPSVEAGPVDETS